MRTARGGKSKAAHLCRVLSGFESIKGVQVIATNQPKAQAPNKNQTDAIDQKSPTPSAIEKALRVLTTRYRVTLEPLPKVSAEGVDGRDAKEIVL